MKVAVGVQKRRVLAPPSYSLSSRSEAEHTASFGKHRRGAICVQRCEPCLECSYKRAMIDKVAKELADAQQRERVGAAGVSAAGRLMGGDWLDGSTGALGELAAIVSPLPRSGRGPG